MPLPSPEHASILRTILVIEDDTGAADLVAIGHITRLHISHQDL